MHKGIYRVRPVAILAGLIALNWCLGAGIPGSTHDGATQANGQGLDDLFSQPTDSPFAESPDVDRLPAAVDQATSDATSRRRSNADRFESERGAIRSPSDIQLFESSGSGSDYRQSTAMQIRQSRALEETRQRIARLEAARWAGSPSLRPSWDPHPMTASRFPNRHVIRVPAYVYPR